MDLLQHQVDAYFKYLVSTDNNNVHAFNNSNTPKLIKITNGGNNYNIINTPSGTLNYAYFINSAVGWINIKETNQNSRFFYTSNGGTNWSAKSDIDLGGLKAERLGLLMIVLVML
jgi:hypothetical protein